MKVILITGLDGSGKSSIFSKLQTDNNESVSLLNLPYIDLSEINETTVLYKYCKEINFLNDYSHEINNPKLKALSLFSAMLLFEDIVDYKSNNKNFELLICERHPLVDISIYSQFYAGLLDPSKIDESIFCFLDENYLSLFSFLIEKIPLKYRFLNPSKSRTMFHFLYSVFYQEKKDLEKNIQKIFNLDLPNEIYFLKADPKILLARINKRNNLEPHENITTLQKLAEAYTILLANYAENSITKVNLVDAASFENLDKFIIQLKKTYNLSC